MEIMIIILYIIICIVIINVGRYIFRYLEKEVDITYRRKTCDIRNTIIDYQKLAMGSSSILTDSGYKFTITSSLGLGLENVLIKINNPDINNYSYEVFKDYYFLEDVSDDIKEVVINLCTSLQKSVDANKMMHDERIEKRDKIISDGRQQFFKQ